MIVIKKIGLTNFKSWKQLDMELGSLTVLFGANSSGKTGILKPLLALKQTASSIDPTRSLNFGTSDRDYVDLGSYRDMVFRHDTGQDIEVRLVWSIPGEGAFIFPARFPLKFSLFAEVSYQIVWRLHEDNVVIKKLRYETEDAFFEMLPKTFANKDREAKYNHTYKFPDDYEELALAEKGRYKPTLPPPQSCYGIPREAIQHYGGFLGSFSKQFEMIMDRIIYLGPLRENPRRSYLWADDAPQILGIRGERTIDALIASARQKRNDQPQIIDFVEEWLHHLGLIDEFRVEPISPDRPYYEPRIRTPGDLSNNSIVDVGFGISQVLPVITQLFLAPEGSIILLEQPEIHLHPSAQSGLADLFLTVAKERNLQLIIESHSEYLLTRLQRRIAESEAELATPQDIRLYFCEMTTDGAQITEVRTNQFGEIENWPQGFFGDRIGDINAMTKAGLQRRREMLANE